MKSIISYISNYQCDRTHALYRMRLQDIRIFASDSPIRSFEGLCMSEMNIGYQKYKGR